MIIDPNKPKKEYFDLPTVREILMQFAPKDGPISVNNLAYHPDNANFVVGTKKGSLDDMLEMDYTVDSLDLVEKVTDASDDQRIILPPDYRIPSGEVQNIVVYSHDSLILLDSMDVKRRLIDGDVPKGTLTKSRKEKEKWSPEKVISTAFNLLHERREEVIENIYSCYSWWGKGSDRHRRIVSVYRSIQRR